MNDCKYGYDIHNGEMHITLLKSGVYPNENADKGHHRFVYSIYPYEGSWAEGKTVNAAYALNNPMEASGSNAAIRSAFDAVCNAGRIILTGWPKNDTSIATGTITKKELDVRGARTSAGEFEEALELIAGGRIDMPRILTKVIGIDDAPETIRDIEKNPGSYMNVVVNM